MTTDPTDNRGVTRRHKPAAITGLRQSALVALFVLLLSACTSSPPQATPIATPASATPTAHAPGGNPPPTVRSAPGSTGLTVFAASSLQESFTEAGTQFRQDNPAVTDLQFNFQGSQQLVAQLQQGAPADVFASADKPNMDKAVQAGLIDGAPQELAHNLLVVVLPHGNPANIRTLHDLARPGVKLSLADPGVPAGKYSLQAFDNLAADPAYGPDFKQKALDNVVSHEDNVRQVLTRVQLDQVDAGIVYTTDALAANSTSSGTIPPVETLDIPAQYNVIALYYIAPLKGAPHPTAAHAWITYIVSQDGQAILQKYGFEPVTGKK
jgi:molybdate transport system substrate-binding protein